ncbi:MAG: Hsp20/alpha crystallin family protein [Candidatus Methanomethylophilaceae archaeon]|nr:Hsp20/alpha crystallin family protein [Candidatus Methanomethylophilaceae archaeon]
MISDDIWNRFLSGFGDFDRFFEDVPGNGYGYVMYRGPDGVCHRREFGNTPSLPSQSRQDPLIDVTDEDGFVRVVAEMPGVEKEDIQLRCTGEVLSIKAEGSARRYARDVALPCGVDPDDAKAEYNNGILEVVLRKITRDSDGTRITVE